MKSKEIRKKFLDFFEKKGHKIIPSSSLVPQDPTSLFTSAGMQQLVLYFGVERDVIKDFGTRHLVSCQKCFRSDDIEEVGDDTHNTFFEMLGNWSIGEDSKSGYFKEGAIKYALEFFCDVLGLDKNRFWITIFKGNKDIPKDGESEKIWQKNGIPKERIKEFGEEDNLWGPVGKTGPCGPNSEIHYDRGEEFGCGEPDCGPNCPRCQRFVELWNLVFIEYRKDEKGNYIQLPQKNVDTGVGFERLVSILQKKPSPYETDLFWSVIQEIEKISQKKYSQEKKNFRILVDHLRGAIFLIVEGIFPSNLGQGYVLRRILRRTQRINKILGLPENWEVESTRWIIQKYQKVYPELRGKENDILVVIEKEKEKFGKALEKGLKEFEKRVFKKKPDKYGRIGVVYDQYILYGSDAFDLYQTYGFPPEFMKEICKERNVQFDEEGFRQAMEKHRKVSRAGVEKKFGGVGKEVTHEAAKLHTATHLLHQALREVLGEHVKQMGSDITPQRLRFDFSHPAKLTEDELKKVEDLVNQKIEEDLVVKMEEMSYARALESGALAFFKEKYPEKVTVYAINGWSREICAGPHVNHTGELGQFEIIKEESSGGGVRRIRAVLK